MGPVGSDQAVERLRLGLGIVLAILAAVTAVAVFEVRAIDTALRADNEVHASIQRYAIRFRGSAHDRSIAIRDVVLGESAADRRREVVAIAELAKFYAGSAAPLEALIRTAPHVAELERLYGAIKDIEARAVATTQAIVALVDKGERAAAQAMLWSQARPQYVQWLASINALIDYEEKRIQAENAFALRETGSFMAVMLAALAASLLCGALFAWRISRSIVRQLGAEPDVLGAAARRVADLINEIGTSTIEQTQGIGQINDAVAELDRGTQRNAALVEENAAAADNLRQQAGRLAEAVRVFRLGRHERSDTAATV